MPRPKIKRFRAAGDAYFILTPEGADPLMVERPVLRVPAEIEHLVKIEWPRASAATRHASAASLAG